MDIQCLLCASTDSGNEINILNNEYSLQRVNEVLNLSIKPSEENLPQYSCRKCWVKIVACKDFQQKCINTINHHKDNHRYRTKHAGASLAASIHTSHNSIVNMETNGIIISDVRSGYNIHTINDSGSDSVHTLLLPMSPINDISHYNSESGGYLKKRNSEIYICSYCNNKYKMFHFYNKHILKHEREEIRKNKSSNKQLKTFKCETCDAEFSKKKQLKVHMFEHKAHFMCSTCNQSFVLEDKYKWHIAQCEGKHRAGTDDAQPFRRRTRSQSVASSGFVSFAETDYQTSKWVADVKIYDNDDDDNDDCHSVRSDTTIGSTFSGVSQCSQITTKSSISIRSSYSTKPTLTTEALLNTKNVLASMPQTRHTAKQIAIVNIDINMREKSQRRNQTPFRKFPLANYSKKLKDCFCGYKPKDLLDIVTHDVKIHNTMLCYRCIECNTYFTRPEYLRMHEDRDHINKYKCYMCGTMVTSKSALKLHYEYHVEKTHNCESCEMSFLKINQLIEHNNPHPETYKQQTVCRILESHAYIERPEKIPEISDGKLKLYERIQKTYPIKKIPNLFIQRLGGRVKTLHNIQDRIENQVVNVPATFWEQRATPYNIREELPTEEECDETENSEICVPDYDGEYDECSNIESENNNSIRLDDEKSENLEENKSLEELQFFSTEDLLSNPRSSRSASSEHELNEILAESDGIKPMDVLEEDISSPTEEKTILNNSLSPSTSKSDVLESNSKKYTIDKRLKRKFLYKVRTKEVRIIKSAMPSYNELLVHQSLRGFKISSHKNNVINGPWRLANENLKKF